MLKELEHRPCVVESRRSQALASRTPCLFGVRARSDAGPGSGRDLAVSYQHGGLRDLHQLDTGHSTDRHGVLRRTSVADVGVSGQTVVGGWTLNAGAPAYTFVVGPGALTFNGAGLVINAGSATIMNQGFGAVTFSGASTAGSSLRLRPRRKPEAPPSPLAPTRPSSKSPTAPETRDFFSSLLRLLGKLGAGSDARGRGLQKIARLQAVRSEHRYKAVTVVVHHVDRSRLGNDSDHRLSAS